jgi:hypothetical protein
MADLTNPYDPPHARSDSDEKAPPPLAAPRLGSGWLLLISVALVVLSGVLVGITNSPVVGLVGLAISIAAALWGVVRGSRRLPGPAALGGGLAAATVVFVIGNLAMAAFGGLMALVGAAGGRGRQLRRWGRVLLPPVRAGGVWAESPIAVTVPEAARAALAAQWRENGRTEHASVAAFARLTLDLMALGAPPDLIAAANRDALDEIRHTELCFSLARALDGANEGPGQFPEAQRARTLPGLRPLALAKLAVDSLIDGALHEGVSARIIAQLAKRCEEPAIRVLLKELAADEGRHAAHGWQVVDWCLAEGGRPVAQALLGAVRRLPTQMHSTLPEPARDGGWERWGVPGQALEGEEYQAARAQVVGRLEVVTARGSTVSTLS